MLLWEIKNIGFMPSYKLAKQFTLIVNIWPMIRCELSQAGKRFGGYEMKQSNYYKAYATKIFSIVYGATDDF